MDRAAIQVERALWLYTFLLIAVTVTSWVVFAKYPTFDRRPLFAKYDQFHDLTNFVEKTKHLYHGAAALGTGQPIFPYPAPAAFVYKALLVFPRHPIRVHLGLLMACVLGLVVVFWRATAGANPQVRLAAGAAIATTAAIGYPLWFVIDRGNIEIAPWGLAAIGLCFLLRARYRIAAVLIGLAASIKPFPVLFLILLSTRKKYKEAAIGLATAVLVTLAALTYLGPNPWKAFQELRPGVAGYSTLYLKKLAQVEEARFLHSMLDGMKSAALIVEMRGVHPVTAISETFRLDSEPGGWRVASLLASIYPFLAAIGLVLLYWIFGSMPRLNQLIAVSVAVTLLPMSAADYTLLQLFVSFGALLVFWVCELGNGKTSPAPVAMFAFATIYALLFAPLTFLRVYAGDGKLVLLIALLFVAARFPMKSEYFDGIEV